MSREFKVRLRLVLTIREPAAWVTLEKPVYVSAAPRHGDKFHASRLGVQLKNGSVAYDVDAHEYVVDFDPFPCAGIDELMSRWLRAGDCSWEVGLVGAATLRGKVATVDAELCEWRGSTLRDIEKVHGIRIVPDRDLELPDGDDDDDNGPSAPPVGDDRPG